MTSLGVIQCNYQRWSACYQFPWYSTRRRVVQTGAACAARTRGAACTDQRDRATRWSAAIDRTDALGYAEEPHRKCGWQGARRPACCLLQGAACCWRAVPCFCADVIGDDFCRPWEIWMSGCGMQRCVCDPLPFRASMAAVQVYQASCVALA